MSENLASTIIAEMRGELLALSDVLKRCVVADPVAVLTQLDACHSVLNRACVVLLSSPIPLPETPPTAILASPEPVVDETPIVPPTPEPDETPIPQ
jgi:hypothetical protein